MPKMATEFVSYADVPDPSGVEGKVARFTDPERSQYPGDGWNEVFGCKENFDDCQYRSGMQGWFCGARQGAWCGKRAGARRYLKLLPKQIDIKK